MATIRIKPSKVGSLHRALGIKQGEKIPASKLKIKESDSPAMVKKKTFAANARKWKHEFGGPLNEESLLGNKIINVPAEYVFNSYLDQPKQYGFGSWMDAPVNADGTSGGLSANGMLATQGAQVVGQGIQDISDAYRPEKVNWGSNIGGGALKGAGMGAAVGSIVPGVGTVIGGAVGGAVGAIGGGIKSVVKAQELKREKENALIDQENMLKKVATNRLMSHGGPLNFNSNVGNQLLSPVAGSITKDLTQSEYDELDQKKALSDLSRGKLEFANGGKIDIWYGSDDYLNENHLMDKYSTGGKFKELSSNWIVPTYGQGGDFDFIMANGGHPIQPNVQDVDGSNMDIPSTNNNIYTKGGSTFTKRRGGVEQPSEDFTAYDSGQTHEQSPLHGIPVGKKALTETGEVRYNSKKHGAYIFSNKF